MASKATPKPDRMPRFVQWIDGFGVAKLAAAFGVTRFTVNKWRVGAINLANGRPTNHGEGTRPDPSRMPELIALAAGALTAADIYPAKVKK